MANASKQPDTFELTGGGASISFDARSSRLHYQGPTRPPLRDFLEVSETVEPVETPIGHLVTATLKAAEDGDSNTVSVLLPRINLRPDGDSAGDCATFETATFETVGIWTSIRSTIGGPGLVDGVVQTYTHETLEGTARVGATSPCEFSAIQDREPPGPAVLHVRGACTFGTEGFTIELSRHEPQGFNPRDLLLDLKITPPDGVVADVVTTEQATYEEQTEFGFDTVTILPDGTSIPVVNAI